jgi:glyceraldehyde 3-phosphate dehydrogenase
VARLKVGINGFGRIGRVLFRAGFDKLDIVGINDLSSPQQIAHLLKYDSTHGIFPQKVEAIEKGIMVGGKSIPVSSTRDPAQIPWKDWGVDLVFECTGAFKDKEDFMKHVNAGAKRVMVSAPAKGSDLTCVYGINHKAYNPEKHHVISNASCTTNCLTPVAKVLSDSFGIDHGLMTTIHSYTNDQQLLDAPHSDLRRARAAALSMIPTTTGAAKTVAEVLPELKGKLDGIAIRVPTPNVSLVDFTFTANHDVTVESINQALITAADGPMKEILGYEKAPLVSCDYNGNRLSSIVDLNCTFVSGKRLAKVFSWYDNETGFSYRMVDLALAMNERGL